MKKIILMLGLILVCSFAVKADMNVSVGLNTFGGNADIYVNPNTGNGSTEYFLNGKNFDDEISYIHYKMDRDERVRDWDSIFRHISDVFMVKERRNYVYTNVSRLRSYEYSFRKIMENFFVPRRELVSEINRLRRDISNLQFEVMALRNLYTEEQICKSKLQLGLKHDIQKIKCNNQTYRLVLGSYITVNEVESTNLVNSTQD